MNGVPLVYLFASGGASTNSYSTHNRSLTREGVDCIFPNAMASLGAETLVQLRGIPITNSLVASVVVDAVILAVVFGVRRRLSLVPGRFQGVVESVMGFLSTTVDQVAGPRAKQIFPWVAIFFIYIVFSNLIGLLPGFGSIGFQRGDEFVPLLRGSTADLNETLALAVVSVIATHAYAIRTIGLKSYLTRFFALSAFFFVGLLELVQELTKFISFSFRLFGNISGGEMVLGAMSSLFAFIVPVPFLALEILVAVIQAMIFSLLTMAFMTILSEPHEGGGHSA